MNQPCARIGCTHLVGSVPYRIADRPEEFCSSQCTDLVFEDSKKRRKPGMRVPAQDFGGAEVTRLLCDNPDCRKPVLLEWRGRDGVYCTNDCLEKMENTMTEATETNAAASPIAAGSPAPKKAPKKAAAKKAAPAKKAAAPKKEPKKAAPPAKGKKAATKKATGSGRKMAFPLEHVIHKTDSYKDHGFRAETPIKMLSLIKEGMTVGDYVTKRRESGLGNGTFLAGLGLLQTLEKAGRIKISAK